MRYLLFACLLCGACGEQFLDVKPTMAQRVPEELADYMALMDNTAMMNTKSSHALGMIGADEFIVLEARYDAFPTAVNRIWQAKAYVWSDHIFQGGEGTSSDPLDWNTGYQRILWSNLVLDGLERLTITESERNEWENVKGIALFHRAFNYYNLAQLHCPVYGEEGAGSALGLPLRLEADLTQATLRSTVGDTYEQIERDLFEAEKLLTERSTAVFRPSKHTAYALLARLYLQKGEYENAVEYAGRCIQISSDLLDFNTLDATADRSFPAYGLANPEVIFMNSVFLQWIFRDSYFSTDPELYASYDPADLRRSLYFMENPTTGNILFKGSYEGTANFFTGLATDEMYLIRAESAARLREVDDALADLNLLRKHRYNQSDFAALDSDDPVEVLDWILEERRKELVLRGTRWEDLRRLNKDPDREKTLTRELGDFTYQLLPGSAKYMWPIPVEAVQNGGYPQNPR